MSYCCISDEILYHGVSLQTTHCSFVIINDRDSPILTKYNALEFHVKRF